MIARSCRGLGDHPRTRYPPPDAAKTGDIKMPSKNDFSPDIRWPEEWAKKSVADVEEFLQRLAESGQAFNELSERDQDFFNAIHEMYTAWAGGLERARGRGL
jgi:hypothetical protein